ncbi:MAG: hypothetical protein L0G94_04150 [Brachybacterium sp.]|uniref:hypothetical protein n=1 Tax=Brachybacterium sp. TaxID=1891286 RepID=UPI002649DAE5|nr:hypothetical protein [Brachybacterium sp.]MDN5685862.1 hypothetical protein [Brachybacterium sp.]
MGGAVVVLVVLAIIGQVVGVPEEEQIQVKPTSEEPSVQGMDDPTRAEDSVVLPLPETDKPEELAPKVAEVLGSADTARFTREQYVETIASAAPEIPNEGKAPTSPEQWAEQVVTTAWKSDPWEDRAKVKTTDTFTPQTVRTADEEEFLDFFAPESKKGTGEAREYLRDQGLVVMEVEGTLLRMVTNPEDGVRKQIDQGTQSWTVAMLCGDGETCKVFLALPGGLDEAREEG